jgi:hypothetical protein
MNRFNRNIIEYDESFEDFKVNKMDHNPLKFDKIYALKPLNRRIYRGIYIGTIRDKYGYIICKFRDVMDKQLSEIGISYFSREYTFYDIEEIIDNGKKARQTMEQRALDMILKGLVNEQFQWS